MCGRSFHGAVTAAGRMLRSYIKTSHRNSQRPLIAGEHSQESTGGLMYKRGMLFLVDSVVQGVVERNS